MTAGSNPVGGVDVCLLRVLCVVGKTEVSATGRSLFQRSPTEGVCITESDLETSTWGRSRPLSLSSH
jgi:hypothetical protein